MRPGSEALQAARLEGRQPVTIVVRYDSQTKTVTPDWRLEDVRTGRVFEVKSADDMDRRRQWWSMTCEALR
jgi:head-tail adaptor